MANPGRIVAEIGKALGKAVIAGVGLELARVATKAIRARFGDGDDGDDDGTTRAAKAKPTARQRANASEAHDDAEALRRENAALREELGALRRDLDAERKKP